jgi:hypothetical protein
MTDFDQNGNISEENEPSWMAMPDIQEGPVDFACWLCQADEPEYTLELFEDKTGLGRTYRLCGGCVERLLGQLEKEESDGG